MGVGTLIHRDFRQSPPFTAGSAAMTPDTSDRHPLPAKRPRNPVTNKDKVKRVFGVEIPHWEAQLRSCLLELSDTSHWDAA